MNQIFDGVSPANNDPIRVTNYPGTSHDYSGGGSTLLQIALEMVTGEVYASWMQREVFDELGMTCSTYEVGPPASVADAEDVASGHDVSGNVIFGQRNNYPESAAAGLYTTVEDMCQVIKVINWKWHDRWQAVPVK